MSADNGVYILKTGKQYRVKHLTSINRLYWDSATAKTKDTMQPDMIMTLFGDCKYTYDANTAIRIALNVCKKLDYCEYGVVVLDAERSWGSICKSVNDI